MIEYQLYQGNVIEFLTFTEGFSEESHDGVSFLASSEPDTRQGDAEQSLLDDDYYPLGFQNATIPEPFNFPHKGKLYPSIIKNINGPAYLPNPPPPRLS